MELKEPRAGSASLFYWEETNHVGFIGRLETDGAPVLEEAFVRVKLGVESGTRQRQAVDCATFSADHEVFSHLLLSLARTQLLPDAFNDHLYYNSLGRRAGIFQ